MNEKLINLLIKFKPNPLILVETKCCNIDDVVFSYIKSINCNNSETFCNECKDCQRINNKSYFDMKIINGNHETVYKEEVKNTIDSFLHSSLEKNGNKFLLIYGIENANNFVNNTLLKTIESPPKNTYYIFTCRNEQKILPTIKSRCEIYKLDIDVQDVINKLKAKNIDDNHIDALISIFFNFDEMIENYENGVFNKIFDFSNALLNSRNNFNLLKKLLDEFKKMSYYEIELILNYFSSLEKVHKRIDIFELINLVKINVNKILIFNELTNLLFWE